MSNLERLNDKEVTLSFMYIFIALVNFLNKRDFDPNVLTTATG